eukprot:3042561-Amphidinium_carterae.1
MGPAQAIRVLNPFQGGLVVRSCWSLGQFRIVGTDPVPASWRDMWCSMHEGGPFPEISLRSEVYPRWQPGWKPSSSEFPIGYMSEEAMLQVRHPQREIRHHQTP